MNSAMDLARQLKAKDAEIKVLQSAREYDAELIRKRDDYSDKLEAEIARLQARIAEYERGHEWIRMTIAERDVEIDRLRADNENLREALGYYAQVEGTADCVAGRALAGKGERT
jgi:hypothetical protein